MAIRTTHISLTTAAYLLSASHMDQRLYVYASIAFYQISLMPADHVRTRLSSFGTLESLQRTETRVSEVPSPHAYCPPLHSPARALTCQLLIKRLLTLRLLDTDHSSVQYYFLSLGSEVVYSDVLSVLVCFAIDKYFTDEEEKLRLFVTVAN